MCCCTLTTVLLLLAICSRYNSTTCDTATFPTLGGEMQAWCDCVETCEGACDIDVSRAAFRSIAFFFGIYYFIAMILCVHDANGCMCLHHTHTVLMLLLLLLPCACLCVSVC